MLILSVHPFFNTLSLGELEADFEQAPLAMGGLATFLITVCLAMMNFREVTVQTLNVGNLCFAASVGLLISAQWEMVRGNTFSYTVLSAYGMCISRLRWLSYF